MIESVGRLQWEPLVEEEELLRFLSGCAEIGYGKSKKQVLCLVEAILTKKQVHL